MESINSRQSNLGLDPKNISVLFSLGFVWWAGNNLYALDAHALFQKFPSKFLFVDLAFAQILLGIVMSLTIPTESLLLFTKSGSDALAEQKSGLLTIPNLKRAALLLAIGFFHITGTVLTNSSYKLLGSTSTLVWKLTEPLAAMVLKRFILGENTSFLSFTGMALVLGGVLLFSKHTLVFATASPIVIANLCFPLRNILTKRDQAQSQYINTKERFLLIQLYSLPFCLVALLYKYIMVGTDTDSFQSILSNAVLFNSYQFASIALLERMDALTHSLANTLKRFTGIILSAIVIGDSFVTSHIIALIMAALGFPIYVLGKESDDKRRKNMRIKLFSILKVMVFIIIAAFSASSAFWKATGITNPKLSQKEDLALRERSPSEEFRLETPMSADSAFAIQRDSAEFQSARKQHAILILERYVGKKISYSSYEEALADAGDNHGNLVWVYAALQRLIDFSGSLICETTKEECVRNSTFAGRRFVHYRPTANLLNTRRAFAYDDVRDVLQSGDVYLYVGIGIQYLFRDTVKWDDLSPGTKIETSVDTVQYPADTYMFLNLMQKHRNPMLVRGDFTLRTNQNAGYHYGVSTGCPSLFINQAVRAGRLLQRKYDALKSRVGDLSLKIAINYKANANISSFLLDVLNRYENSLIYAQDVEDYGKLQQMGVPFDRTRLFSDVEEWMQSLSEMDVAFGVRIHGNMAALGTGTPALVIAMDHRVLELTERMRVPYVTTYDVRLVNGVDVASLVSEVGFNGEEFDRNRCVTARLYEEQMAKYGMEVHSTLRRISSIC
ncbi:Triose phosphate/phosphate translocator, chloroplastic [Gracilariopsis chorda]|uniref:Triose phosphate/phosphate translocator, chloroplastic n=1 Tax=Gracilariopsis chorda TaxID=448386 RepID=A0A2V3IEP2_9FLOR|nr:Triose phosphate/phosphate translocator, chloroplastic [Gracilariopsis chorda]|eukprot:PXF40522.1 Triose phosphate/phosphate translocator, chloroplastic [Gracilariopsis chorda]